MMDLLKKDGRTAEGNRGCSPAVFSLSGAVEPEEKGGEHL